MVSYNFNFSQFLSTRWTGDEVESVKKWLSFLLGFRRRGLPGVWYVAVGCPVRCPPRGRTPPADLSACPPPHNTAQWRTLTPSYRSRSSLCAARWSCTARRWRREWAPASGHFHHSPPCWTRSLRYTTEQDVGKTPSGRSWVSTTGSGTSTSQSVILQRQFICNYVSHMLFFVPKSPSMKTLMLPYGVSRAVSRSKVKPVFTRCTRQAGANRRWAKKYDAAIHRRTQKPLHPGLMPRRMSCCTFAPH